MVKGKGRRPQISGPNDFNGAPDMNAHLPERFHRGHPRRLNGEDETAEAFSGTPPPYAARLQAYFKPASLLSEEDEWTSIPEFPQIKELVDENDNNDIHRLHQNNVNLIDKPWNSKSQYLETHYKLLREDSLRPLREAVRTILEDPEAREPPTGSIGLYDDLHVSGLTFSHRGIGVRVSFSLRRVGKNIIWNQSKRLVSGSLVVLVPSNARYSRTLIVAIVASRVLSLVDKDPPEIDLFFAQPSELEIDAQTQWVMVEERTGFFEAERHTLLALQKMMNERYVLSGRVQLLVKELSTHTASSFPLAEHLVDLQGNVDPPRYVLDRPKMDLQSVFPSKNGLHNAFEHWPAQPDCIMDESQQAALKRILTKRIALVQGPPGTGKTFVSTEALDIMLRSMHEDDPPIVIACQTNHALDQILRQIALKWPECFVRLGSRSRDVEVVQQRTLYKLRDSVRIKKSGRRGFALKKLRELTKRMKVLLDPIQKGYGVLKLDYLQKIGVLTEVQVASIVKNANKWQTAGISTGPQNELQKWVGSELKPFVAQDTRFIFPEVEETELDVEELNEAEAENAAKSDQEEFDFLKGDFIAISDDWVGNVSSAIKSKATGDGPNTIAQLVRESQDLGCTIPNMRGAVYNQLVRNAKDVVVAELRRLAVEYSKVVKEHQIGKWEEDAMVLDQFKIIGVTTTGLSKYRPLIAAVQPKVVLIEEAAETLEAPVATTCVESLQHLILVGDHKQLRPHCHTSELEGDPHNLNISLFERLVNNNVEFSLLRRQRRMIPGIRRLLQPLYGDAIEDHALVKDKEARRPIPGMGKKSTWFYHHTAPEAKDDQVSFYNDSEAAMIVEFIRYLLYNGTPSRSITVLTFYNGQRRKVKLYLRRRLGDPHSEIQVITVDSYQGEENGIIILSLVRNNSRGSIGFLAVENRICVALSRAQRALYIFGNGELLCGESKIWCEVIKIMYGVGPTESRRIGFTLPLQCKKHKRKTWITNLQDWEGNAGGCDLRCDERMHCGHTCAVLCHPSEAHDCMKPCEGTLPCSHRCKEKCSLPCRCRACEDTTKTSSNGKNSRNANNSAQPRGRNFQIPDSIDRQSRQSSTQSRASEAWKEFGQTGCKVQDEQIRIIAEGNTLQAQLRFLDELNHQMLFEAGPRLEILGSSDAAVVKMSMRADGTKVYKATCKTGGFEDMLSRRDADNAPSLLD